jgi:hypothetical protein
MKQSVNRERASALWVVAWEALVKLSDRQVLQCGSFRAQA